MYNTNLWITDKMKLVADTTYLTHRMSGSLPELLVHTETMKYSMEKKIWLRHHSAVIRIKKDRSRPNTIDLHGTLYLDCGRDDPTRQLSRAVAGSMFGVPGDELGRNSLLAQSQPGATHAIGRIFIRDTEYVNFNGIVFKLKKPLVLAMEQFLRTWTFPPAHVERSENLPRV